MVLVYYAVSSPSNDFQGSTFSSMSSLFTLNPRPFIGELVGKSVVIKLKWGQEYRGLLVSTDSYMNFQMSETEEWINEELAGELGDVMIRCNNVLYVRDPSKDTAN